MPIYAFKCPACGASQDAFLHIADRDTSAPECCGAKTERQITACMVFVRAFESHKSVITGEIIQSERQRREMMAREGLVDANDYKPADVIAKKKAERAKNYELAAGLPTLPEAIREQVFAEA
jgi:putative FmdB family regulatory protein